MLQCPRDPGCIDFGKAGLVACSTVYSSGIGQGISVIFLEIFDGMNGILACLVDVTGTAVYCTVMSLLFIMTVLAERGDIT
jgi:hypothetical protein